MPQLAPPLPDGADAPDMPFPPRLVSLLADLACLLFRREMLPGGEVRYPWISPNVTAILGYSPRDLTVSSKGALNAVHWADRDTHVGAIRHSAAHLTRCHEAFRIVTAGGETRWFRGSSLPTQMADGRVTWEGAWTDISPWMRAERQFQTVMDHAEDLILTLDADGTIDWVNAAGERHFGHSLDQMSGRPFGTFLATPDFGTSGGSREVTAQRADGTVFPMEMTVSEVRSDGKLSLIVIGRDITRRKTTEALLEESERRLRTITANLPGIVFQREMDTEGVFTYAYVSEGVEEILGLPPSAIVADCSLLFDAMIDEDRRRVLDGLLASSRTLEPVREDVRIAGTDGRLRWLRGQSRPRRRGEAIVWDGVILDVTEEVEERRRAEAAVRDSEERFRMAFAAASLGIVVVALDGTIQQCNPAFRAMCSTDALEGTSFFAIIDRDHVPMADGLAAPGGSFSFDYAPVLPDGRERHWRATGTKFSATPQAPAPSLLFLIEDVTEVARAAYERRQLELALQEGHKLEALGRLAGGVAHELNNMLGPILMAAEMIERSAPLDERNRERCRRIIEAAKHGRDIVRNVLAYCRKEQNVAGTLDMVPAFTQFATMAASILPPSVKVETRVDAAHAPVRGEATQVQQILLNLANNARDAMDGHGTLRLHLGVLAHLAGARSKALRGLNPARPHVEIRVEDTGCGMRPETIAKIFDPFFTTKPVGQGTGLGLSVVQGIVTAMGGAVAVDSAPGRGTTFRILLPMAEPADD